MEYICETEILPLMEAYKADFLAFAVTPWHAHNLDASLARLKQEKNITRGIILISPSDSGDVLINEEFFNTKSSLHIAFYLYKEKKRGLLENLAHKLKIFKCVASVKKLEKDDFYIISSRKPNFGVLPYIAKKKYMSGCVAVVYDEGLAMYMRDEKQWLAESFGDQKALQFMFHYVQRVLLEQMYEAIMNRKRRCWKWGFLKKDDNNGYVVNPDMKPYLLEILQNYSLRKGIHPLDLRGKILFLTQPYSETKAIDINDEKKIIDEVLTTVTFKYPIVHKAHPREKITNKYDGYKLEQLDCMSGVSVEALISVCENKPIAVIGYTSTALITLKTLWGIPAFSLVKMIKNVEVSQVAQNDFDDFTKTFGNSVYMPQNQEELLLQLASLE